MYHLGPQSCCVKSRCGRLFLPFLLPVFLLHHHHLSDELNCGLDTYQAVKETFYTAQFCTSGYCKTKLAYFDDG